MQKEKVSEVLKECSFAPNIQRRKRLPKVEFPCSIDKTLPKQAISFLDVS